MITCSSDSSPPKLAKEKGAIYQKETKVSCRSSGKKVDRDSKQARKGNMCSVSTSLFSKFILAFVNQPVLFQHRASYWFG
jgi:hypothetical protein